MRNPLSMAGCAWACIPVLLVACGGGGGGGGGFGFPLPPPTPAPNPPPVASAEEKCTAFAGASLAGATLREASFVAATETAAEYCKITGTLHGTLNFELHLPTAWNNKLLYAGGGGWNGSISITPYSPSGSTGGYVLVASDGGRQGDGLDASDFLNNPTAQADFGYLSIHSVNEVAREIVRQRYGKAPDFRYFEGCSNGGREALVQATRFPNDFDGIVVRAPAYSFTELFQAFIANGQALAAPGGQISNAKASLIADTVRAQCDGLDGAADGIVSNQLACTFDPAALRCTSGDADTCLTDPQVATAKTIYSELKRADGSSVYPGWGPGGEDQGWPVWVTGTAVGGTGLQFQFGSGLVKYWVTGDPAFDVLTFDPEIYTAGLRLAATTLDATPDLRSFFGRGGKMILVHGTHDWAISYKGSIKYFDDVATTVGGAATRDASMEFFLQPGVQHCAGGVDPDTVDLVDAVVKWRESGTRPSTQGIVAKKLDPATRAVVQARPLCRHPAFPKYNGSGDLNLAESYSCQTS
jgi:hypothetical protein